MQEPRRSRLLIFVSPLELMFALNSTKSRFTELILEPLPSMTDFNASPLSEV